MNDEAVDQMEELTSQDRWPGVEVAYDFVIPSYQWILIRPIRQSCFIFGGRII